MPPDVATYALGLRLICVHCSELKLPSSCADSYTYVYTYIYIYIYIYNTYVYIYIYIYILGGVKDKQRNPENPVRS